MYFFNLNDRSASIIGLDILTFLYAGYLDD